MINTEFNLQICNYGQKRRIRRENSNYTTRLTKIFCGHFCPCRKTANFCHPGSNSTWDPLLILVVNTCFVVFLLQWDNSWIKCVHIFSNKMKKKTWSPKKELAYVKKVALVGCNLFFILVYQCTLKHGRSSWKKTPFWWQKQRKENMVKCFTSRAINFWIAGGLSSVRWGTPVKENILPKLAQSVAN